MNKFDFKTLAYSCLSLGLLIASPSVYGNEETEEKNLSLLAHNEEEVGHILAAGCGGGSCGSKKTGTPSNTNGTYRQVANSCSAEGHRTTNETPAPQPSTGSGCAAHQHERANRYYQNNGSNPSNGSSCSGQHNTNSGSCNGQRAPISQPSEMSPQSRSSRGYLAQAEELEVNQVRRTNLI